MYTFRFLLLLCLAVFWSACGPLEPPIDEDVISGDILKALDGYAQASSAGNVDGALNYFICDERFIWAEDGTVRYSSFDELRTAMQGLSEFGSVNTEYSNQIVHILTADYATVFANFSTTIGNPADGGFSFSGVGTINMVRTEGGWKIMSGHTSTYRERQDSWTE